MEAFETGYIAIDGHRVYWEQCGNPEGVPVVFLHGGPGAGSAPAYRRFFDPDHYRVILLDQRGSGKSAPTADLTNNTTSHLISDLEVLRRHLQVEKWIVFGGSWGSTLALAYGQSYPKRCVGFILRGIFLFSSDEVRWFLYGMRRIFPEAWRVFSDFIPHEERNDLLEAYYKRLCDPNPDVHKSAAASWCSYENACSRLLGTKKKDGTRVAAYYSGALSMARIEAHYMMNKGFLRPNQLLSGISALNKHPSIIVQGRYDIVCPIETADKLARAWTNATYRVVADAGHSSMEPGIRSALVKATNEFRRFS